MLKTGSVDALRIDYFGRKEILYGKNAKNYYLRNRLFFRVIHFSPCRVETIFQVIQYKRFNRSYRMTQKFLMKTLEFLLPRATYTIVSDNFRATLADFFRNRLCHRNAQQTTMDCNGK